MKKTLRVLAGAIAVALLTAAPTLGRPDVGPGGKSGRFAYVGGDIYTYVPPVTSVANQAGVAPLGHFTVVPASSTLTVTIDDLAATDGQEIHVYVWQSGTRLFSGCIPVRTKTAITGAVAAQQVSVFMAGPGYAQRCTAFATSGVVTVGGLQ